MARGKAENVLVLVAALVVVVALAAAIMWQRGMFGDQACGVRGLLAEDGDCRTGTNV